VKKAQNSRANNLKPMNKIKKNQFHKKRVQKPMLTKLTHDLVYEIDIIP